MTEIQNQVVFDEKKALDSMVEYLTQSHIFIKYSKSIKKNVLLVYFNENLQKLIFEINKQTRKAVMLTDIYYSEPGLSKELIMHLYKEDIKNLYGLKIVTKKRIIELSAMHRSERDLFVKNLNLLIQVMKEWKSTNGLRNYFMRCLEPQDNFKKPPTPVSPEYKELESQIIKDLVSDLLHRLEYDSLNTSQKKLHSDFKLINYENQYIQNQYSIFKNQTKEKDKNLEGILTIHTHVLHKYYLRSIWHKAELRQEKHKKWKKVLEFLDSKALLTLRGVNKFFWKLVKDYLSQKDNWARLCYLGLKPRSLLWIEYLREFFPFLRSKSLHYDENVEDEIRKDVSRGLPDRMNEVEEALKAICSYNHEVGYCQGMQLVTHFLFTVYNDSDKVIETLKTIMEPPYYMGEIWKSGFSRLKLAIFQLEFLVGLKVPYLLEHLRKLEINLDIIVTPWIVTIFSHMTYQQKLPIETLKLIWDMFIVLGWPVLISASLAILYISLDQVLDKNLEETLSGFYLGLSSLNLSTIKKFSIDPQFLMQLEDSFNAQNK